MITRISPRLGLRRNGRRVVKFPASVRQSKSIRLPVKQIVSQLSSLLKAGKKDKGQLPHIPDTFTSNNSFKPAFPVPPVILWKGREAASKSFDKIKISKHPVTKSEDSSKEGKDSITSIYSFYHDIELLFILKVEGEGKDLRVVSMHSDLPLKKLAIRLEQIKFFQGMNPIANPLFEAMKQLYGDISKKVSELKRELDEANQEYELEEAIIILESLILCFTDKGKSDEVEKYTEERDQKKAQLELEPVYLQKLMEEGQGEILEVLNTKEAQLKTAIEEAYKPIAEQKISPEVATELVGLGHELVMVLRLLAKHSDDPMKQSEAGIIYNNFAELRDYVARVEERRKKAAEAKSTIEDPDEFDIFNDVDAPAQESAAPEDAILPKPDDISDPKTPPPSAEPIDPNKGESKIQHSPETKFKPPDKASDLPQLGDRNEGKLDPQDESSAD